MLAIPEAATTIAELNGHTIGEATVEHHSRNIFYCTVYVDPQHRRQGVGRQLPGACAAHAAARGGQLRAKISQDNLPGLAFLVATAFDIDPVTK